jgi:dihydrolipoamide dehydrogenase
LRKLTLARAGKKSICKTAKGEVILKADILLSAVGIKTNIENIGLEAVELQPTKIKSW